MSSFARNIQRKRARGSSDYQPKPQYTVVNSDGSYTTVRHTRGPLRVSVGRLAAQAAMANLQARDTMAEQVRAFARITAAKEMAEANEQRIGALVNAPVRAITRQMRRQAARTGQALPPLLEQPKPKRVRKPRAKKVAA